MVEIARLGNEFTFQVGNGASPEVFADFCAVIDPGAIGEEKPLIDITSLCDEARVYRGGLADGVSIPLKCNFVQGDAALRALYVKYQNNATGHFRLIVDNVSPSEYFEFAAIITAWNMTVQPGTASSMTFTLKVSGALSWVYA